MAERSIREPGHISVSAYARHRGTDAKAIRAALAKGVITLEPDGFVDPAKCDAAWERNADPAYRHINNRIGSGGLADARLKGELLKGELAEERLVERRKELIDRAWAVEAANGLWTRTQAAWRAWPERIAPRMAIELGVDADRLRRVLERVVAAQLKTMHPEDVSDLLAPGRKGAQPMNRYRKYLDVRVLMQATAPVNDGRGFMAKPGEMFWTTPERAMEILAGQWGELLSDEPDVRAAVAAFADEDAVVALARYRARQALTKALLNGFNLDD